MKTKSKKTYITEKNLANRRFFKTEKLILEAFIKYPEANISKLSKKANISRPTFYRHHKTIFSITKDYEKYLQLKFKKQLCALSKQKNIPLRKFYQNTLFFILGNKKIFQILISKTEGRPFLLIVEQLRPKIERFARLPKNSEKIFQVYVNEVATILLEWSKKDFCEEELGTVLNDIMYLSETAHVRLLPLVHNR